MARRKHQVAPQRPTGRRRALELCKDLLIVLLTCSAVYLAARSQLYADLSTGWLESAARLLGMDQNPPPATAAPARPAEAVRPVAIAFCTGVDLGGGVRERCGIQYAAAALDKAFEDTRRLLGEALAGASAPRPVGRDKWEAALQAPGIYFDLLGDIPLASLAGWLGEGGTGEALSGAARRLVLADLGGASAVLYYSNEEDGLYYACDTSVPSEGTFTVLLNANGANGARFAFEAGEEYAALAPDVLLSAETPKPAVYTGSSPITPEDESQRRQIQYQLSFQPAGYPVGDGWVNDTLRIGRDGTVTYDARESDEVRYPVAVRGGAPDLTQAADLAWALAAGVLSAGQSQGELAGYTAGEARLCLIGMEQTGIGAREIRFGYLLDGTLVELEGDVTAARFLVENGRISYYQIKARRYVNSGETTPLLPEVQAAAMADPNRELALCYFDPGGAADVRADWVEMP